MGRELRRIAKGHIERKEEAAKWSDEVSEVKLGVGAELLRKLGKEYRSVSTWS